MNIVLIGYRGSGKTTIGLLLAERLSLRFVDIDHGIMARYDDKSVAEIWDEFGEPHYRATECDVTEHAMAQDGQVVALGGGTPMERRAYNAIAAAADTVRIYLKAPAEALHPRIAGDEANTDNRPSLTALGGGLDEVRHMLEKREPTYETLADHVVDVAEQSPEQAAEQIISMITENGM